MSFVFRDDYQHLYYGDRDVCVVTMFVGVMLIIGLFVWAVTRLQKRTAR